MNSLLIIDDDEDIGDALLTLLKDEGYQVRLALSGKEGLVLAKARPPKAILLDWQMPQMGGDQVLLELASNPKLKDVPVILMSANIANIPASILKDHHHLGKPFDVGALIDLVTHVLTAKAR